MTNTTVYYYSATGNSLVAARTIARRLGNTELVSMKKSAGNPVRAQSERIGLVFPVHIWGLPVAVADFINNFEAPANAFIFAVATHGGMPCATLKQAQAMLKRRSLRLSAGYEVKMVGNCTTVAEAPVPDKQEKILREASLRIEKICGAIEKRTRRVYAGIPVVNWIFSTTMHDGALKKIPGMDAMYTVDARCNGCGICQKVCRAHNISMENGRPVWQHHCEACYACLQWCPTEAIQITGKTEGRRRYRHPDVRMADIVNA
jgi:Pyruvate/2-oxoacid:ferredoxin oxidoreductase delta subunit